MKLTTVTTAPHTHTHFHHADNNRNATTTTIRSDKGNMLTGRQAGPTSADGIMSHERSSSASPNRPPPRMWSPIISTPIMVDSVSRLSHSLRASLSCVPNATLARAVVAQGCHCRGRLRLPQTSLSPGRPLTQTHTAHNILLPTPLM
jgi:hypothetical protein